MKGIETMITNLILILNLIITTPQLLPESYYLPVTILSHLMLLLPGLLVSKFQDNSEMGFFFSLMSVRYSSLSLPFFLDKRCFENENVFSEGEIEGSRGKISDTHTRYGQCSPHSCRDN